MADQASTRAVKTFFGDYNHVFLLGPLQVEELEKVTGLGIGAICRRVFKGEFSQAEVLETLRLGLIGGGIAPNRAADLVKTYAEPYPLDATYPVAVAVLEALWFGDRAGGSNGTA